MRFAFNPLHSLSIAFILFCLIPLPVKAMSETMYQGETTLWQDTLWSGDIVVDGMLTVAPEATLEIRPGTTIRFTFIDSNNDGIGEHELFIQGRLLAQGTVDSPITFTAFDRLEPGSWGAINMMVSNDGNMLSHCIIEYAYRGFHAHFSSAHISDSTFTHNMRGLQFQESSVSIARSKIVSNFNGIQFRDSEVSIVDSAISSNMWGVRCLLSKVDISQTSIRNNGVNGVNIRDSEFTLIDNEIAANRRGVYLQRSRGNVAGNRIFDNSEHGIFLEDSIVEIFQNLIENNIRSGIKIVHSDVMITENNFVNYGAALIVLENEDDLDGANNCYENLDDIDRFVVDGTDRAGYGHLLINPSSMVCKKYESEK